MSGELAIHYLGLGLSSPVIVGACPLTLEPETVRQLAEAGAGAIVLPSMLQEQIVHRQIKASDPIGALERSGYQPQHDKYNGGADNYLRSIGDLKKTCSIPIIANLHGASSGDWLDYAKEIESAGADALEINIQSMIFDPNASSDAIESDLCGIVKDVVDRIAIPVAAKVSQRYTNVEAMALQLQRAGADGIVLFTHLPNWDVCTDRMHWTIRWELSPTNSINEIFEGIVRVRGGIPQLSIAASGGISTSEDAIKAMIAGADVVMTTSAVYRDGPDAIRAIVDGIERYIELSKFRSLIEFQQARPTMPFKPGQQMRLDSVDSLTAKNSYFDPTPTVSHTAGDRFGHKS